MMKFRPCLDLHVGRVKQIVGGSLNDSGAKENYVSNYDADYYASMYMEKGLLGGHIIALGTGNEEQINKALKAYPGGMQVGGGVNPDNGAAYIRQGASHVIVTSYIFNNGQLHMENLKKMVEAVGKDKLVIDLSCRKKNDLYYVVTDRWQQFTDFEINEDNIRFLEQYADEFLVHAVDVEGLQSGIDNELLEMLSNWVKIPCTYAGGITTIEDMKRIKDKGHGRIDFTVGSAMDIFGGKLPFDRVVTFGEVD
jgi:phosphoribosylformimino-5-aminoimidazole carboxamide ribotide isomerase